MSSTPQDVPKAPPTKWTPAFEAVLSQIVVDYEGQDAAIREAMSGGMRKLFERPYQEELGHLRAVRRREEPMIASAEDAQRIIFFPQLPDMQIYVDAFALDASAPTARRQRLMKIKLLALFYTLHRKDGALVERFLHYGGLEALCDLLGDESMEQSEVVKSQVVELLMECLEPYMKVQQASSGRQAHALHKVWKALRCRPFWKNFSKIIADPAERFPRSHENSLRIVAGSVGWLRPEVNFIPEKVAPPDTSEAIEAIQAYLNCGRSIRPDIRGVGEDLLEELQTGIKVREDPLRGFDLQKVKEELFEEEVIWPEAAAQAWQSLRKMGNEAFKKGLIWPAEAAYGLALQEGGSMVPDNDASLILSNRSLMLLKAGHHRQAAEQAAAALKKDPRNAKAAFRKAMGLEGLLGSKEGPPGKVELAEAKEGLKAAALAAKLEPKDAKIAELLARFQVKVEELERTLAPLVQAAEPEPAKIEQAPLATPATPECGLDEMD